MVLVHCCFLVSGTSEAFGVVFVKWEATCSLSDSITCLSGRWGLPSEREIIQTVRENHFVQVTECDQVGLHGLEQGSALPALPSSWSSADGIEGDSPHWGRTGNRVLQPHSLPLWGWGVFSAVSPGPGTWLAH